MSDRTPPLSQPSLSLAPRYAVSYGARFVAFLLDDVAKHRSGVFTRLKRHREFQKRARAAQSTRGGVDGGGADGGGADGGGALRAGQFAPPPAPLSPIMSPTAVFVGTNPMRKNKTT